MFSLPNLAPSDSYTLWYASSHSSNPQQTEHTINSFDQPNPHIIPNQNQSSRRQAASNRSPLARLRQDEEYIERRKQNVQNWGSSWIKPPGVPKSLHQLREERRELEEHQEALRREQLAQELAEAEELEEATAEAIREDQALGMTYTMVDLDDAIPEAEETGFGGDDLEELESEEEEENDADDVPRGVLASRMPDREAVLFGESTIGSMMFGGDDGSTIDDGDRSGMLQEEDLVHEQGMDNQDTLDMNADLDDDIPDADGGYEHTDTEELSSEMDSEDGSLPNVNPAASMVRSDGTQNSMDLSNLISHDSSLLQSSPHGGPGR